MRACLVVTSLLVALTAAASVSAQSLDCRRAAAACAEGFACVQTGDAWDCLPSGSDGSPAPSQASSPSQVLGAFPDGLALDAEIDWLVGTWALDVDATLEAQEMSDDERQMAQVFMSAMSMSLTFDADGTMAMEAVMFGETSRETGTWSAEMQGEIVLVVSETGAAGEPLETAVMECDFGSRDVFAARERGHDEIMYFARVP